MSVKKILNPEQVNELTARIRSNFTPEYFRRLRSEFPKERVMKYFGPKQEPGVASALWCDDPETYLKAKMAGVYFYDLPNNLQKPEPPNDGPISDNEQYKERLR
jgi:hypothetical protein